MIYNTSKNSLATLINQLRGERSRTVFADLGLSLNEHLAYEIARENIGTDNRCVVAWKLGGTTAFTRALFQVDNVYMGPLLEGELSTVSTSVLQLPDLPVLAGEAEIALRLRDAGANMPYAVKLDPIDAFDAWAVGVEFPYSVFSDLPDAGIGALLADRCAAGSLVLGNEYEGIPPGEFCISIILDNGRIAEGNQDALLMSPVEAALEFRHIALEAGFELKPGQWVTTGGVTKCLPLDGIHSLTLKLDGETEFTLDTMSSMRIK